MLNIIHEFKLYAHCHTWSEALCPLLHMELIHMGCSYMLNAIHGVKHFAQCYTRSEAICSLLHIE